MNALAEAPLRIVCIQKILEASKPSFNQINENRLLDMDAMGIQFLPAGSNSHG